ncbi:signal transduction protein [Thermosulfidibacter takaii ABI70S6]|uniref:diguanylate cyclase n=1 Tax=Thermosulfidibacter takaii (strain DSM 17441 / JCM 13301 / NBRC 103674 / ABI70S6) TaxID=1298851 RepID=A0A0S3QST0_THET7|nr:GGDEF domain-containing protein [Thermosulfidibacter takaii]BAT71369.1 signal transduction protein [Thermosulfidibacter takaii ABI70S6]
MEERVRELLNKVRKGQINKEDIVLISEIARRTLKYLVEKNIPVTPENYQLFFFTFAHLMTSDKKEEFTDKDILETCKKIFQELHYPISLEQLRRIEKKAELLLKESSNTLQSSIAFLERHDQKLSQIEDSVKEKTTDKLEHLVEELTLEIKELRKENKALSTELKKATQKLSSLQEKLATHIEQGSLDFLTQVLTRAAFERILSVKLETFRQTFRQTGKPFCLIMLDPDDFKQINDKYGHLAGDQVLRSIAFTLKESVREEDAVARYGGDEFAVLISLPLNAAIKVAERIKENIEKLVIIWEDREIRVTVSMGIAEAKPTDNILSLIHRADKALYIAKKKGKNKIVTELELQEEQ